MPETQPRRAVKLAPSILSADFARLGEQLAEAEAAGADWLHLDVMDGRFVPNLSFGPPIVAACRRASTLPLDVHLMMLEPERYVGAFAEAGASSLTVHAEVSPHLHRTLAQIREAGMNAGLALNPLTPLAVAEAALPYLDVLLVMSVNPGFGGQRFIEGSLARLRQLARWRDERNPECLISVDGGIDVETAPRAVAAGAEVLVAGSAVFNARASVAENLGALRATL